MTSQWGRQGMAVAALSLAMQVLGAGALVTEAGAAPIAYAYRQTGSTPGNLPIAIEMTFADPGVDIAGNSVAGGFTGLLHFSFRTTGVEIDLQDLKDRQAFCAANPGGILCAMGMMSFDLTPDEGSLRFNNTSFDFAFTYDEGGLRGSFNTDFPGPAECRRSGACTYEGRLVEVPGPAGAALLLGALVPLAVLRRRRG